MAQLFLKLAFQNSNGGKKSCAFLFRDVMQNDAAASRGGAKCLVEVAAVEAAEGLEHFVPLVYQTRLFTLPTASQDGTVWEEQQWRSHDLHCFCSLLQLIPQNGYDSELCCSLK